MTKTTPLMPYAELAALYADAAYEDPATFQRMVGVEDGEDDCIFIDYKEDPLDVQAYIHTCHRKKLVIVAVRGTEPTKWEDWLHNLRFRGVHGPNPGLGKVHGGFLAEAKVLAKPVCAAAYKAPGYTLLLTGHSKGGSLCTVLQHVWSLKAVCHTFGECRSLSRKAAGLYRHSHRDHTRWVDTVDAVPKLLWWRYRHIGRLVYLDRHGDWNYGYRKFWDRVLTRLRNPLGGITRHSMTGYRKHVTAKGKGN